MHDVRICILHAQPSGRPVIDDLVSNRMTDARTYTHRTGVRSHVLADACAVKYFSKLEINDVSLRAGRFHER